jgi:uncharacterized protein (DUF58 family)
LDDVPTAGRLSDLRQAVDDLRRRRRHRGLVVILSDFLNVPGCAEALTSLVAGRARVLAIQVLDPIDRGTGLDGMLRLRDSESGRMVDVRVNPSILARYRAMLDAHQAVLELSLHHLAQDFVATTTVQPYLELVCRILRAKAVLR